MIEPTSGTVADRRQRHAQHRRADAAARHRLRHPERRPVPAPHRARQHRHGARAAGHEPPTGARALASGLLERVGLPAAMGRRYPAQLSGGQQQRVGVARALAADPPVMLMDEPFSAVDPVVRAQLQDEFIRLQDELGKTIVFVTHDIDEAVKLGDRIAVFAVGGRLAQYAPPSEVLTRPADDFVADFVGRDRGYRALSFAAAGQLPLLRRADGAPRPTRLQRRAGARQGGDPEASHWWLVVDDDHRPRGWAGRPPAGRRHRSRRDDLCSAAPWRGPDSSLRTALDAALSSPSGRGVAVDADGRVIGTLHAREVLDAIEAARGARPDAAGGARRVDALTEAGGRLVNWEWLSRNTDQIVSWLVAHVWLAALPTVLGLLIALPLGAVAHRYRWSYAVLITLAGLLYTIPSLALFVVLPGAARHPDPRPAQRGRRADAVHPRAAGPGRRRRAGLGAAAGPAERVRDGLPAAAVADHRPATARDPGDRRGAAGGRGVERVSWCRSPRCSASRSSASCSPPGSSSTSSRRSLPASCCAWSGRRVRRDHPARRPAVDAVATGGEGSMTGRSGSG